MCVLRFFIWDDVESGERIAALDEMITKAGLKVSDAIEAIELLPDVLDDGVTGNTPLALDPMSTPRVKPGSANIGIIIREAAQYFRRGLWTDADRPFAEWCGDFDNVFNARRFNIIQGNEPK